MRASIIPALPRSARWLLAGAGAAAGALVAASSPASAATSATFANGVLSVFGDSNANAISISRNANGAILVNGGAIPVAGGTPTVAKTAAIQLFGLGNNDVLTLDEANGALPRSVIFGGSGNDTVRGGSGGDLLFGLSGNDTVEGRSGQDLLLGGTGDDTLVGGDADDQAFGERGNDTMVWNPGDDTDLNEGGRDTDTVQVNGGNGAEDFAVTANGTRVRFDRTNPAPFAIDIGTSENLVLNANGGDDRASATGNLAALIRVTVDGGAGADVLLGSNGADVLLGGDGNDFVDGQQGDDTALLGSADDTFQWDPGDGSDVIEGQDGTDTMLFNGSGGNEIFDTSANGGRVRFTRNLGNIVMDLDDVEDLDLNALGGADTATINDLSGTDLATFDAHLAGVIGGPAGDGQADTVIVNGTNGPDGIAVAGAGTSVAVTGLGADVTLTNSEGANDGLVVNALGGGDVVQATALPAGVVELTIDGGADDDQLDGSQGADVFRGGAGNDDVFGDNGDDVAFLGTSDDSFQWDPGDGNDILEGEDGTDTMLFNGANAAENIDIAANGGRVRFFRDVANVTMDLDDLETIDFRALDGTDNIVVGDLSGTDVTLVAADLAGASGGGDGTADTITVNGTDGADAIGIEGGAAGVGVSGLPARVAIVGQESANDRLTLNALGGDDTVDASGLAADGIGLTANAGLGRDVIVGSAGSDLINGGDGNDTALMGAGDDTFVWNPGDDDDTLEGQAGADTMLFNGANAAERIDIAANGGRVRFFRDVANVTMDLDDVETIDFRALGGADNVDVGDVAGTDVNLVVANLAASGGGDGQADVVSVDATNGDDVVLVSGDGNGTSVLGLAARVDITGAEAANDRLVVNALAGDDIVEASGLAAGAIQLSADGGDNDDVLIGGAGDDVLLGGPGDDVLLGGGGIDVIDGGDGDDIEIPFAAATGQVQLTAASGDRVSSATPADAQWVLDHVRMVDGAWVITIDGRDYRVGIDLGPLVAAAAALETSEPPASEPETSEPLAAALPIGDLVWDDTDGDGLQDVGEPGLGGVAVRLLDGDGGVIAEVVTDDAGHYELVPPESGADTVEVVVPTGYRPTLVDVGGDDAVDSDADPAAVTVGSVETTVRIGVGDGPAEDRLDVGLVAVPTEPSPPEPTAAPPTTEPVVEPTTTAPAPTSVVPTTTVAPTTTVPPTTPVAPPPTDPAPTTVPAA